VFHGHPLQGSGKTLAFGLPIIQMFLRERAEKRAQEPSDGPEPARRLRALILAPARELALQVSEHLEAVGRACGVWCVPIVGGISAQKQERMLSKRPEIVVATPGRLWDLMREGHRHITDLGALSFFVIDEADRMVQQGNYAELGSIVDAVQAARPLPPWKKAKLESQQEQQGMKDGGKSKVKKEDKEGAAEQSSDDDDGPDQEPAQGTRKGSTIMQTFVFSATLTLPGELRKRARRGGGGASGSATLESLMDRLPLRSRPKVVDLTPAARLAEGVQEACITCPEEERDEYLYCLLARHPGRTVVFANAVSAVRRLSALLRLLGLPSHPLHSGMQQRARLKSLDRFKAHDNAVLVATDVAARGLDVQDVKCVVHYQLPASVDVYVHRSGRTGRAASEGVAIALVTPKEAGRHQALLKALGKDREPPEFPTVRRE
jgi:ATP-dependent RNA helicase DDX24/MAK5